MRMRVPSWGGSCEKAGTWPTAGYKLKSFTSRISLSLFQSRIFHLLVVQVLCTLISLLLSFLIYTPMGNKSTYPTRTK